MSACLYDVIFVYDNVFIVIVYNGIIVYMTLSITLSLSTWRHWEVYLQWPLTPWPKDGSGHDWTKSSSLDGRLRASKERLASAHTPWSVRVVEALHSGRVCAIVHGVAVGRRPRLGGRWDVAVVVRVAVALWIQLWAARLEVGGQGAHSWHWRHRRHRRHRGHGGTHGG